MAQEYILGTNPEELERLGIQHRVWSDLTIKAWKRAGIGPGIRALDVGAGPGHASFDMAGLIGKSGSVIALDASDFYVSYLNEQAQLRGMPQLKALTGDVMDLAHANLPKEKFDLIYCRWVLCWLKEPEKVLQGFRELLKDGGHFVIHDYFNWKIMTTGPRSPGVEKMVAAAIESFKERGGDMDIASHLPKMLRNAGLKITHFDVHQKVARGGGLDPALAWPLTWWRSYGPKLVSIGKLKASDYDEAASTMDKIEADPDRFFFCPPLFEFIGGKA